MRVAIIGSRNFPDLARVVEYVTKLPQDTVVVSGGARGVDSIAEEAAHRAGLLVERHRPDYKLHGRRAPLVRNADIVKACDRLVAFWDGESTGTMHAVSLARKMGKRIELIAIYG